MPFKGFLGPSWKMVTPTRILRRHRVYYHTFDEYTSIISKIEYFFAFYSLGVHKELLHDVPMGNGDFNVRDFFL